MHPNLNGSPDIILKEKKVAIFLHGCFWHKCPIHYKKPKTKRKYWLPKIEKNIKRDMKNRRLLRRSGWKVLNIWEHEVKKDVRFVIEKIIKKS